MENNVDDSFRQQSFNLLKDGIIETANEKRLNVYTLEYNINKLDSYTGFTARYHLMMRLIELFLVQRSYTLAQRSPHKAAAILLKTIMPNVGKRTFELVKARHLMKYQQINPGLEESRLLENLIICLWQLTRSKKNRYSETFFIRIAL